MKMVDQIESDLKAFLVERGVRGALLSVLHDQTNKKVDISITFDYAEDLCKES